MIFMGSYTTLACSAAAKSLPDVSLTDGLRIKK